MEVQVTVGISGLGKAHKEEEAPFRVRELIQISRLNKWVLVNFGATKYLHNTPYLSHKAVRDAEAPILGQVPKASLSAFTRVDMEVING
jgi:hypothetical protein